jgi:quercetin dioxygenase-like cupin family protein
MFGLWMACLAAQAPDPKAAVVMSYEDARFKPLNPSIPNSAEIAALRGDPDKGPSTMLMKMRRGVGRLHEHTADYELIVIEGTMKHWRAGENEATVKPLGVGSYWFQPGGQPHADSCLTDTCVMFITWSGPRDSRLFERQQPQEDSP